MLNLFSRLESALVVRHRFFTHQISINFVRHSPTRQARVAQHGHGLVADYYKDWRKRRLKFEMQTQPTENVLTVSCTNILLLACME